MTDIHLLKAGGRIIGLDPFEKFRAGLAHAREHHGDAERLILTGDLTDAGTAEEYERLREALSDFDLPVSFLIGNHDRRAAFKKAFPEVPTDENGFIQSTCDLGDVTLVFLDTVNDIDPEREHSGLFCGSRQDWLTETLTRAESAKKRVILFMHHPPFPIGFAGMDAIALRGGEDFLANLRPFKNIAHLIAGHVHRTISGSIDGLGFSILKSTCHQMPMEMHIPDSMLSVDEPAAYGILLLAPNNVIVHSEDFELAGVVPLAVPA